MILTDGQLIRCLCLNTMSVPEKQVAGLIQIKILLNKSSNRLPNPDFRTRIVRFGGEV